MRLCMYFFTNDMVRMIRSKKRGFDLQHWYLYREYHAKHMERVHSRNAVFLFHEFQNMCETIASLSNESQIRMYILCKTY